MMDLMKMFNDPEAMSQMAAMPQMLAALVTTLQEIRDAVMLQNRIAFTQYLTNHFNGDDDGVLLYDLTTGTWATPLPSPVDPS